MAAEQRRVGDGGRRVGVERMLGKPGIERAVGQPARHHHARCHQVGGHPRRGLVADAEPALAVVNILMKQLTTPLLRACAAVWAQA